MKTRKATLKDKNWIRDLSNECIEYMFRTKPISKDEHEIWFSKHMKHINVIGKNYGAYWLTHDGFITIKLFKKYRNRGIGTEVLRKIKGKSIIFIENQRSIHAHYKAGFKITGFLMEK